LLKLQKSKIIAKKREIARQSFDGAIRREHTEKLDSWNEKSSSHEHAMHNGFSFIKLRLLSIMQNTQLLRAAHSAVKKGQSKLKFISRAGLLAIAFVLLLAAGSAAQASEPAPTLAGTWGYSPQRVSEANSIQSDSQGLIHVLNGQQVAVFNQDGTFHHGVLLYSPPGTRVAPSNLLIDSHGNYVVMGYYSVVIYNPEGEEMNRFSASVNSMAIDSNDQLYVKSDRDITVYDLTGQSLRTWPAPQGTAYDVLILNKNGNPMIRNPYQQYMAEYDPNGVLLKDDFSQMEYQNTVNDFSRLVHTDAFGFKWTLDVNGRLRKWSPSGESLLSAGVTRSDLGEIYAPSVLAVSPEGVVQTTREPSSDLGGALFQPFSSAGMPLSPWGTYGFSLENVFSPRSITTDREGNVYVAELYGGVKKFGPAGVMQRIFVNADGQSFSGVATAISIDGDGFVYVASPNSATGITKFTADGVFVGDLAYGNDIPIAGMAVSPSGILHVIFGNPSYKVIRRMDLATETMLEPIQIGQTYAATAIAIDRTGNIYLLSQPGSGATSIQKYSPEGEFLTKWGDSPTDRNSLFYATSIGVDDQGNVYVSDTGNSVIRKYAPAEALPPEPSPQEEIEALRAQLAVSEELNQQLTADKEQAQAALANCQTQLNESQSLLSQALDQLDLSDASKAQLAAQVEILQGQITTLTADLAAASQRAEALSNELDAARNKIGELETLNQNLLLANQSLTEETGSLRAETAALQITIENLNTFLESLSAELSQKTVALSEALLANDQLRLENQNLQGQLAAAAAEKSALELNYQTSLGELDAARQANSFLQTELAASNLQLAESHATQFALQSSLAGAAQENLDLSVALTMANQENSQLNAQLAEANQTIEQLRLQLASSTGDSSELLTLRAEKLRITNDLALLQADFASLFKSPGFVLAGTPADQAHEFVNAALGLNKGQKQALYLNLGGTKK
jgi:streptogramin lyase